MAVRSSDREGVVMSDISRRRPVGVAIVVGLTWLVAFLDIAAGAFLFFLSFQEDTIAEAGITAGDVRAYAILIALVGLLTAAVAIGLGAGSNLSRVVVIALMVVRIGGGIWALAGIGDMTTWSALYEIGLGLLVIAMLSTRSASDYFRGRA